MSEKGYREVFVVEDWHGDEVKVIEWGDVDIAPKDRIEASRSDASIGCLMFVQETEEIGTVHLRLETARNLGERLIKWATEIEAKRLGYL